MLSFLVEQAQDEPKTLTESIFRAGLRASILSSDGMILMVLFCEVNELNVLISAKIEQIVANCDHRDFGRAMEDRCAKYRSPMSLDLVLWTQERGPPSAWAAAAARRPRRPS